MRKPEAVDEAVDAVRASAGMDRLAVRASVEHRFDSNRMVDDYLAVRPAAEERERIAGGGFYNQF